MAHMYIVNFDTQYNNVRTDYFINVKANNQEHAKKITKQKWEEKHSHRKRCPHPFHMIAKRTVDSVAEDGFHVVDWNVVDKSKDPFYRWLFRI